MSHMTSNVALAAWAITIAIAVVAAVIDVRRFRVPNLLTLPLCVSGLLLHTFFGGFAGLKFSAAGLGMGMALLLLFYILGVMGAGDVKLLAGVGAWLGPVNATAVFFVAALVAGVQSLIVIAGQNRLYQLPAFFQLAWFQLCTLGRHIVWTEPLKAIVQRPDRRRLVMPFAVMIAIGLVAVALHGLIGTIPGSP